MRGDEEIRQPNRLRWLMVALVVLLLPLSFIWMPGCRQYPPVSSPESLKLMKLLYSACNSKNQSRLAKVEAEISKLSSANQLTVEEREAFERIIKMAKANQWQAAELSAFQFAQDQINR